MAPSRPSSGASWHGSSFDSSESSDSSPLPTVLYRLLNDLPPAENSAVPAPATVTELDSDSEMSVLDLNTSGAPPSESILNPEAAGSDSVNMGPVASGPAPEPAAPTWREIPAASHETNNFYETSPLSPVLTLGIFEPPFPESTLRAFRDAHQTGFLLDDNRNHAFFCDGRNGYVPHQLPGLDPSGSLCADLVNGSAFTEPPVMIKLKHATFHVPRNLFAHSPVWVAAAENHPESNVVFPDAEFDLEVFGLLLEILHTPSGLTGTEEGINLVKLTSVLVLALYFFMWGEALKVSNTIKRYIVHRVLRYNAWNMDGEDVMLDHNYFRYRSDELYRTSKIQRDFPVVEAFINLRTVVELYVLAVPDEMWPALAVDFDADFFSWINQHVAQRVYYPEHAFLDGRSTFKRAAGFHC